MLTLIVVAIVLVLLLLASVSEKQRSAEEGGSSRPQGPLGPPWLVRRVSTDPKRALKQAVLFSAIVGVAAVSIAVDDWMFRAGVAYPISAALDHEGVGAVRVCEFSTGTFVETIETWEKGRVLRFTVSAQPPVLKELTPFDGVHPPHLERLLRSRVSGISTDGPRRKAHAPGGHQPVPEPHVAVRLLEPMVEPDRQASPPPRLRARQAIV